VSAPAVTDLQLFRPNDGASWAYRFRVPEGLPGPRRPMGRGFATRRDAHAAAKVRIDELLALARDDAELPTLSALIADYRLLRPGKGGGRDRLVWAISKIEPRFGGTRIDRIAARDVDLWVAGLETASIRWEVSRVFRQLLAQAARYYDVANPVTVASQPRRAEVSPFANVGELERVAVELGEWGDAVRFVAATGLRPEEWIPLTKMDIDEDTGTVTVRRTYTEGKGLEEFVGKTSRSIRSVPLSDIALAAYQAQRKRHPDVPLVFPASRGGYLNLRNWRQRDWHPALETAGVASRGPNALRHTFATWFLVESDDRWLLAQLMGTSVAMVEQHYGHLVPPHAERARTILTEMWGGFGRKLDATVGSPVASDSPQAPEAA
jgi:integrase